MWPGFSGIDCVMRRGRHQSTTLAIFTMLAKICQQGACPHLEFIHLIWNQSNGNSADNTDMV